MATSQEIITAAADEDLLQRAIALGTLQGVSEQGIRDAFRKIVAGNIEVSGATTSVANVYAYAKVNYDDAVNSLPPPPGRNLAGVTDAILSAAIAEHVYVEAP